MLTTPLKRELDLQRCHDLLNDLLDQTERIVELTNDDKTPYRLLHREIANVNRVMKVSRFELHQIIVRLADEEGVILPQSSHLYH